MVARGHHQRVSRFQGPVTGQKPEGSWGAHGHQGVLHGNCLLITRGLDRPRCQLSASRGCPPDRTGRRTWPSAGDTAISLGREPAWD